MRRPPASRPLSRRGLLAGGVLAGVLAASGIPAAGAARGGTLRLALPPEDAGWDLARTLSPRAVLGQGALYEGLVEVNPGGGLAGDLALSWDSCPAARLWTFRLDPMARFHDGAPVTALDVAASLERHRAASPAAWILDRIAALDAPDPLALRVALHEGDPSFPFLLAHPRLMAGPGGRLDGTGSGPYRLAESPPGLLRLERMARHRKDGRAAWFDAVEARAVASSPDRARALLAGEADAAAGIGPPEATLLAAAGHLVTPGREARDACPPFDRDGDLAAVLAQGSARAPGLAGAGAPSRLGPLDGGRAALRWWWA